jgi:hypothetical protein
MRCKELIGMFAAATLVVSCDNNRQPEYIKLVDCESGPRSGTYETHLRTGMANIHLGALKETETDLVVFPDGFQ